MSPFSFRVNSPPAGNYSLAIRSDHGEFVSLERVSVAEGENPPIAVTVASGPAIAPGQSYGSGMSTAVNVVVVSLVVLAILGLTQLGGEDPKPYQSPRSPSEPEG